MTWLLVFQGRRYPSSSDCSHARHGDHPADQSPRPPAPTDSARRRAQPPDLSGRPHRNHVLGESIGELVEARVGRWNALVLDVVVEDYESHTAKATLYVIATTSTASPDDLSRDNYRTRRISDDIVRD